MRHLEELEGLNKVFLEPSLLLAEQPQLSQPFLTAEVFHPSDHFCGLLWHHSNRSMSTVLSALELDTGLPGESHQSGAEGQNLLHRTAGHSTGVAAQDMVAFWAVRAVCCVMSSFSSTSTPKSFLAQLLSISSSPSLCWYWKLSQPRCSTLLGLFELHEVHTGPLLKFVQVPFEGISSLRWVDRTTQLFVVCKPAQGAFDSPVYVIDEDIKQYFSQYRPLWDTTCHWCPSGHRAIDHYTLDMTTQTIPHPPSSPPIKSESL